MHSNVGYLAPVIGHHGIGWNAMVLVEVFVDFLLSNVVSRCNDGIYKHSVPEFGMIDENLVQKFPLILRDATDASNLFLHCLRHFARKITVFVCEQLFGQPVDKRLIFWSVDPVEQVLDGLCVWSRNVIGENECGLKRREIRRKAMGKVTYGLHLTLALYCPKVITSWFPLWMVAMVSELESQETRVSRVFTND